MISAPVLREDLGEEYAEEDYGEDYAEEEYAEEEYAEEDYVEEEYAEEEAADETEEETTATPGVIHNASNGTLTWPEIDDPLSASVMMFEVNTGAVLFSKDIDTKRYPASTTKLMTCLLALENCTMDEIVTFSANAVDLESGATSIDAVEGEQLTMKDCLYGLMVASGNDCAIAIAEHIAGSVEAFAEMMNARAAELGCENTHFKNPHGLFHRDHYTTVYDMSLIAAEAFNNSALCEIISQPTYTIGPTNKTMEERTVHNTNYLIVPNSEYYNEYVVGGKTGYLYESGRCLVTLAKHNGMSIITIAFFCPNYTGVFNDTQELLDYAYSNFGMRNISEWETRFASTNEDARIILDSTAQILMPSAFALDDLDSEIVYAYDLSREEFEEASREAGIVSRDGRHLYATINYSFGEHYLGKVNVLLDDNLVIPKTSFVNVYYVNIWYVIAGAAAAVILILLIFRASKRHKKKKARRAPKVQQPKEKMMS